MYVSHSPEPHTVSNGAYSTLRNQSESPLLRLAPGLRNRIYKYTLGDQQIRVVNNSRHAVVYRSATTKQPRRWTCPRTFLSITATSRQTQTQTRHLAFVLNEFGGYPKRLLHAIYRSVLQSY
jgi:hypothetical protein